MAQPVLYQQVLADTTPQKQRDRQPVVCAHQPGDLLLCAGLLDGLDDLCIESAFYALYPQALCQTRRTEHKQR